VGQVLTAKTCGLRAVVSRITVPRRFQKNNVEIHENYIVGSEPFSIINITVFRENLWM
jgi:hypothetical protein